MKRTLKLGLLSLLLITLTGCSNSYNIDKLNNNILKLFYDNTYIDKTLNSNEKELVNKFIEEQEPNNLVIELNDYFIKGNETTSPNSNGIWEDNGIYYIKYSDIPFEEVDPNSVDIGHSYRAYLACNGYNIEIIKENIPILYTDTKDSDNYKYSYLGTITQNNETDVYYQSYYDNTGLIIRYIYNGKDITDIKIKYETSTSYTPNSADTSSKIYTGVKIVTLGIGAILLGYFIIKRIKRANSF